MTPRRTEPVPSRGERLITATRFAKIVNVSANTVMTWADKGKLAFVVSPGGRRRYSQDDAEARVRGDYVFPGGES